MDGFIDHFYQELSQVAKFPKQPAWLLVGQCMGAMFEAMATIRAKVSCIEELNELQHSKTQVILAILQCNRVIGEFSKLQFRGHTAIVKEMSMFPSKK
jgi:hypothetical protein